MATSKIKSPGSKESRIQIINEFFETHTACKKAAIEREADLPYNTLASLTEERGFPEKHWKKLKAVMWKYGSGRDTGKIPLKK